MRSQFVEDKSFISYFWFVSCYRRLHWRVEDWSFIAKYELSQFVDNLFNWVFCSSKKMHKFIKWNKLELDLSFQQCSGTKDTELRNKYRKGFVQLVQRTFLMVWWWLWWWWWYWRWWWWWRWQWWIDDNWKLQERPFTAVH